MPILRPITSTERAALDERTQRLGELTPEEGAPWGGAANGGAYSFALLPDSTSAIFPGRIAFVDAEDPRRSNWARFVNHAPEDSQLCNCEPHTDGVRQLVWLQARRAIKAGEELCFDCAPPHEAFFCCPCVTTAVRSCLTPHRCPSRCDAVADGGDYNFGDHKVVLASTEATADVKRGAVEVS